LCASILAGSSFVIRRKDSMLASTCPAINCAFSERQPSLHALRADLKRAFELGGRNLELAGLVRLPAALNNFPAILHPPGLTQS
jgi:hypothetical protein